MLTTEEFAESGLGDIEISTDGIENVGLELSHIQDIVNFMDGQQMEIGASMDASHVFSVSNATQAELDRLAAYLESITAYQVSWNTKTEDINGTSITTATPIFTKVGPGVGMGGNRSGGGGGGGGGGGKNDARPQQDRFYN